MNGSGDVFAKIVGALFSLFQFKIASGFDYFPFCNFCIRSDALMAFEMVCQYLR